MFQGTAVWEMQLLRMQQTHLLNSFFTHRATAACGKGCSRKSIRITQFLAKDGSSLQGAETNVNISNCSPPASQPLPPQPDQSRCPTNTICFDLIHFSLQAP